MSSATGDATVVSTISGESPFKIFIGYDPREHAAYEPDLRASNLYWRTRGPTESTDFSFTRFLTPHLASFSSWALFVDCDFLYTADIAALLALADPKYAVMCVHHDYAPTQTTKMDGAVQTLYPRKNWSSMVLYNCDHPKNRVLSPEVVSTQTGAYLHRFMWLEDEEIGEIPFVWNYLVGHNQVDNEDLENTYPKAIHYTLGGPWFEKYKNCEFADLWIKEWEEWQMETEKEKEKGEVKENGEEKGIVAA